MRSNDLTLMRDELSAMPSMLWYLTAFSLLMLRAIVCNHNPQDFIND